MSSFDPTSVNLKLVSKEDVLCYLAIEDNQYNGHLGARISSIFVILFVTSAFISLPCLSSGKSRLACTSLFDTSARELSSPQPSSICWTQPTNELARILASAYRDTGGEYSWCAAIVLATVMGIFLLDLAAEVYVEHKYGVHRAEGATSAFVQHEHHLDVQPVPDAEKTVQAYDNEKNNRASGETDSTIAERSFRQQIAAFLLLEFGIIFHSVIIGLNLGVTGSEFAT
ncbi:uncharacterized protein N7458_011577 [Penicillium daleae]|uniref:Uncharacterized protein n=1 Tax=Penicillium daleae TaxID=63821 RepID=A0AAD6FVS9_9EURO|nr:uncharacterized protein N7458_011577 [Penicillium daleae]KAJ5432421.1 hypothetical protein N7458_011577 [Penicillium daleae]